jgi:hypothetical protein
MHQFIDTPGDIVALTISEWISAADLDAIMDRLDVTMAAHDKVHVFVETRGIESLELSGMPAYIARATPLFAKLNRFGRVAVVADQAWIRAGSRMESAMLPFISYRVFTPDQREVALHWVEGSAA